jgi:hypothetical protein
LYRSKMRPRHHKAILVEPHTTSSIRKPSPRFDNGIEYRLHVRRRAADDTQNFRRRRLMLQCFAQLWIACLQFLE